MGVMAAFIFAAQMFNFQVAGGTSGHLLGGVLAAVLLGPVGRHARHGLRDRRPGARVLGRRPGRDGREHLQHGRHRHARRLRDLPGAVPRARRRGPGPHPRGRDRRLGRRSSLASIAMSLELVVSGTSPPEIVLPAMLGVHVFIGIGEALITAAALAFIAATRAGPPRPAPDRAAALAAATVSDESQRPAPDAATEPTRTPATGRRRPRRRHRASRVASAAGGGSPASPSPPWSSSSSRRSPRRIPTASSASPRTTGSSSRRENLFSGLLGDYAIPGVDDACLSTVLAGPPRASRSSSCSMFVLGRVARPPPRARGAAPWSSTATSTATARSTAPTPG